MTRLLHTVGAELHRAICTRRFAVAMILPLLFYLCSGVEEIALYWDSTHIDVLHFAVFLSDAGSFSMMLILAACFPYAPAYCDDTRHQYIRCQLPRCGERNYCIAKILAGAITDGMVATTGLLLFILLLGLRFPFAIKGSGMYDSFMMAKNSHYWGELLAEGSGATFLRVMVLCCGLFGAMWGAVGIAVSGLMPNPFVAMFAPFLLNMLARMLPIPRMLIPSVILQGGFNLGGWQNSIAFSIAYTGVLIWVCYALLRTCVRRRLK